MKKNKRKGFMRITSLLLAFCVMMITTVSAYAAIIVTITPIDDEGNEGSSSGPFYTFERANMQAVVQAGTTNGGSPILSSNSIEIVLSNYYSLTYQETLPNGDMIFSSNAVSLPTSPVNTNIQVRVNGDNFPGSYGSIQVVDRPNVIKLSIPSIDYGQSISPTVTVDNTDITSSSNYEILYKALGASDDTYTTTVPSSSGSYEATVFIETGLGAGQSATTTFSIRRLQGSGSISVTDFRYGSSGPNPVVSSDTNGIDHVTIQYKLQGADDSTYSTKVPTEPGAYNARAIFAETDKYSEASNSTEFEILKNYGTAAIAVEDSYYGVSYTVQGSSNMTNAVAPIYQYKVQGADDSTYTETKPVMPGNYTVRITYPDSKYYYSCSATDNFSIQYLPAPNFTINGTKGLNGFYTTAVNITTQEGYVLCSEAGGAFTPNIQIGDTHNVERLYFMQTATGAKSAAVELDAIQIDTIRPRFEGAPTTQQVYQDLLEFDVSDTNLSEVLINGERVDHTAGACAFSFDPKGGYETYEIIATDRAGNQVRTSFTLYAAWLEKRIVPAEQEVPLEKEQEYYLSKEGSWQIEGDDTIYAPGVSFYIEEEGRYTFHCEN